MSFDILNPSRHPLAESSLQPPLSLSLDLLIPVWVSIVLYEIKLSNTVWFISICCITVLGRVWTGVYSSLTGNYQPTKVVSPSKAVKTRGIPQTHTLKWTSYKRSIGERHRMMTAPQWEERESRGLGRAVSFKGSLEHAQWVSGKVKC